MFCTHTYMNDLALLIGIDRQGHLFCWYQIQQEDAYQLRLISSYGGIMGVYEDQKPRQGQLHGTTIYGENLTSLPRKMMRSMAGFPTNGRSFCLARVALDPPTSLCKKLFPAIDQWHDCLTAKKLNPDNNEPI
ncbi:hypothetical protein [Absidia glauca]|uniref:Ndc10 domain-containing protein n=1 Tax=Absidia glauca TaxID=4829 RepID=A0A168P7W2_ABSGL|nr:hypothetical protein [Absidia glauca]